MLRTKQKQAAPAAAQPAAAITFAPSWKQHLAWQALEDQSTEEVVYGGAAGGGKSWLGCAWKVHRRLRYPGSRGITCRTRLNDIKESTLITFLEVLTVWGLKAGVDYSYNGQDHYIQFKNGSREVFKDLAYRPTDRDYQRLGSSEYTDAWIEEAGDGLPQKAAEILKSRIRWKLHEFGLCPTILITCNPGYHWVRGKYFFDDDDKPVKLLADQQVIKALVTDNPNKDFVRSYKRSLERLNDYDRQRLLLGDWNAVERTGGEFYPSFSTEQHSRDLSERYDPGHPLHITLDFNTAPYMTLNVWQFYGTECLQLAEFTPGSPENNTHAVCRLFLASFYGQHEAEVLVYGDPAGKHADTRNEKGHNDFTIVMAALSERFNQLTKRVSLAAPSVSMRGSWINAIFRHQEGGLSILIDPRCRNTLQDYQKVKKAADGTKEKKRVKDPDTDVSYEPYGHTSDANEYLLCKAFSIEFKAYSKPKKKAPAGAGIESLSVPEAAAIARAAVASRGTRAPKSKTAKRY